jgi:hypothetical protein
MTETPKKALSAVEKAHRTARWAKTMTKWLISRNHDDGAQWHVIDFVGGHKAESRGIVDLLAVRKDHREPSAPLKRGDLFEIVLIQSKGGSAKGPSAGDIERLEIVARKYHAKAVVLAEWKKGKTLQLKKLQRGKWVSIEPDELF